MDKIRLLIVEDSAFLRSTYKKLLADSSQIEIIDTASDGIQGVKKAIALKPDVITMDIEMPNMNGLDAVTEIMQKQPTPILMVSSLTKDGADATIEALNRGAVDFIKKEPAFSKVNSMKDDMINRIITIGGNNSIRNRILRRTVLNKENKTSKINAQSISETFTTPNKLVDKKADTTKWNLANKDVPNKSSLKAISIGISTGGPISLQKLIPKLSKNISVPIFIVQHMPPNFTKSLAERLDKASELRVKEAENGESIARSTIYIAPGGKQMLINQNKILITDKKPDTELYSPSFNIALGSQIHYYHHKILSVIMTGMGHDGTSAMKKLHEIGGYNIAQDPSTCVVAGMPNSALKAGIVDKILPLENISDFINKIYN